LTHVLTSSDVEFVEADAIASIVYDGNELNEKGTSANAAVVRDLSDIKDRATGGRGVDIYGLDTGINIAHTCFGGRASWGAVSNLYAILDLVLMRPSFKCHFNQTFGGYANRDGNGHGTHTAGTAVCKTYGVATSARIIAVKVLSDQNHGPYSDIISGVNWVYNRFRSSRRPSIATMSIGGPTSMALDKAVTNAINRGLHFTVAAMNWAKDASSVSPARVRPANTVGACDGRNKMASFSDFGSVLDVFAPGVNILSAWIGSTTATKILSGTSMSTPYVAGILAVALGEHGHMTPARLSSSLKSHAKHVIRGQPAGTTRLKATLW